MEAGFPRIHGFVYDVGEGLLRKLDIDFKAEIKKCVFLCVWCGRVGGLGLLFLWSLSGYGWMVVVHVVRVCFWFVLFSCCWG